MNKPRSALVLCILFACHALLGQAAAPAVSPDISAQAAAILEPAAAKFPGLAVAVAVDGRIVWTRGWGFADVERKTPATADTLFRIYSTVKPMTAAAIARLAAEKKIDLDAPIQKLVPEFPGKAGPPVTARLLVSHLSGLRHYSRGEAVSRKNCASPTEAFSVFAADPLLSPPGTKEEYSSYGYVVLSAAVEKASGKPFEEAMKELIFDRAGMTVTAIDKPGRPSAGRAIPYDQDGKAWKEFSDANVTCKFGAGAFLSSANDMARFGSALLQGKIVASDQVAALFEPARTTSGQEIDFGFGWGSVKTDSGRRIGVVSGGNVGGRAALAVDPATKTVVAIVANFEGPRVTAEARKLLDLFGAPR